jgi:hypothetical protein
VQANLPQLILVKEIMSSLLDQEELYGECGASLSPPLPLSLIHPLSSVVLCGQVTTWPRWRPLCNISSTSPTTSAPRRLCEPPLGVDRTSVTESGGGGRL